MSVSLFLLCKQAHYIISLDFTCKWYILGFPKSSFRWTSSITPYGKPRTKFFANPMLFLLFSFWLTSLCMTLISYSCSLEPLSFWSQMVQLIAKIPSPTTTKYYHFSLSPSTKLIKPQNTVFTQVFNKYECTCIILHFILYIKVLQSSIKLCEFSTFFFSVFPVIFDVFHWSR